MIAELIAGHGAWAWIVAGLVLLGVELLIPGVFLMWIGLAAAAVGTVSLVGLSSVWWGWEAQAITFCALAIMFAIIGSRTMGGRNAPDAADAFNNPARRMVGRAGALIEPIDGGIGRARIGESAWRVEGPDLPLGSRVRVVGEREGTLLVEPETASQPA